MKIHVSTHAYVLFVLIGTLLPAFFNRVFSQRKEPYVRIARIVIDSAQLDAYQAALKQHAAKTVGIEQGVLTLYAVYDKEHPTHVTVFEIYASEEAYRLHIQTPHFLQYKAAVQGMVKSLELTDVVPIALETKR